jgi:putative transposase
MHLVEKHIIKKNHPYYKKIDELCFKSKNLYNKGNYLVKYLTTPKSIG